MSAPSQRLFRIATGGDPGPYRASSATGRTSPSTAAPSRGDRPGFPNALASASSGPPRLLPSATGGGQGPYEAFSATGHAWDGGRALAAAIGLLADRVFGEPPAAVHPVCAFGGAMSALERRLWRDTRPAGAVYAAAGAGLGGLAAAALRAATSTGLRAACGIGRRSVRVASGVASRDGLPTATGAGFQALRRPEVGSAVPGDAAATWVVVAGRALGHEARRIGQRLVAGDLEGARERLPALVGRDPETLDAKGVARAVVESVAENTVDAVVAPACWAALGGAAGAGFYRAVNTMDAMVGHRNDRYLRFGWASARLDDVANWIPARLTVLLVAAVRPRQAAEVLDVLVHPPAHPSPNAGIAEAAFAAALGLRLGGDTVYAGRVDPRPAFGTGRSPEPSDIEAATRLSRDVTLALAALLAAPTTIGILQRRVHRRST